MNADPEVLRGLADAIEVRIALTDGARGKAFEREIQALGEILYGNSYEILAALRAPQKDGAAASEWQPIETAPKGEDFYSDLPGDGNEGVGYAKSADDDRMLFLLWWKDIGNGYSETTHWQLLPAPPGPTTEAVKGES